MTLFCFGLILFIYYAKTKHNFGYWVIEELIRKRSLKLKAGKGDYLYAKEDDYLFIKPTSFMNSSGLVLLDVTNYYKIKIEEILIIYDDIDLQFGKMKYKKDWQGKRKDQVEFSLSMVMGGLIGIVVCLLFSLVAVVGMEVWSWLCG